MLLLPEVAAALSPEEYYLAACRKKEDHRPCLSSPTPRSRCRAAEQTAAACNNREGESCLAVTVVLSD